jgi:hypothetical protein
MRTAVPAFISLLISVCSPAFAKDRVFLMALDALGHQRLTEDPAARELRSIRRLFKTGSYADGLTPSFPSTTANAHAALWTGAYVGKNGILYNSTPVLPRHEHTVLERVIGFRSEALTAEPIWLATARQRVPVVAHQVTQAYPFLPQTVGAGPMPGLLVANGYQSRQFAKWRAVRPADQDVRKTRCDVWSEAPDGASACYQWPVAPGVVLRMAVLRNRVMVSNGSGGGAVQVRLHEASGKPARSRSELANRWSTPLEIVGLPDGAPAAIQFRLFELQSDGGFLLLQTPVQESAIYADAAADSLLARRMVLATGPMVGNGAAILWEEGALGTPAYRGGDGSAERRYLETLEVVIKCQIAQSEWLFRQRNPRLHITYLSSADEVDHHWYGFDRSGDARYREFRRHGYALIEHAAAALLALADEGDHVVITSDHGMTAITKWFHVNAALAEAGLLRFDGGGEVELSATRAVAINTCVLLNTSDWKHGIVAPAERAQTVEAVAAALQRSPAVVKVYASAEEMKKFGHDGPAGADLCFDLAESFGPTDRSGPGVIYDAEPTRGVHGLDPTRADMQAVLLIRGPRAEPGRNLGQQQSASVAGLVADLLGIEAPADATLPSPLRR